MSKKNKVVQVPVTEDMSSQIKNIADSKGMGVPTLVRGYIIEGLKNEKVSDTEIQ